MLARQMSRTLQAVTYDIIGGNARDTVAHKGSMYKGPEWFTSGANDDDLYTGIYR
jgi:hypothetical protein